MLNSDVKIRSWLLALPPAGGERAARLMRCSQVARANRTVTVCCSSPPPPCLAKRSAPLPAAGRRRVTPRTRRCFFFFLFSFFRRRQPRLLCRFDTSKTKKSPSWCVSGNCRVAGTEKGARRMLKDFQNFLNSGRIMYISSFFLVFYLSRRKLHTRTRLKFYIYFQIPPPPRTFLSLYKRQCYMRF